MAGDKQPFYWYSNSAESIWKRIVERCDDIEELQTEILSSLDDLPVFSNPNLVYVILDAAIEKGFTGLDEWLWDKADNFEKQGLLTSKIQAKYKTSDNYKTMIHWALLHDNFSLAEKIISEDEITFNDGKVEQGKISVPLLRDVLISTNSSFQSMQWVLNQLNHDLKNQLLAVNTMGVSMLLAQTLFEGSERIFSGLCVQLLTAQQVAASLEFFAQNLFHVILTYSQSSVATLNATWGDEEFFGVELARYYKLAESIRLEKGH